MLFPALPDVLLGVLAGEKVSNTRFEVIMANMEEVPWMKINTCQK